MSDSQKPTISFDFTKPTAMAENTSNTLYDQGYTYNETGQSYNQAGVEYGGIYLNASGSAKDPYPVIVSAKDI